MNTPYVKKSAPLERLIRAMAEFTVAEYLTLECSNDNTMDGSRPNPPALPDLVEAA